MKVAKTQHCPICCEKYKIDDSIFGDYLGFLYHKECVLEKLINNENIMEILIKNNYIVPELNQLTDSNLKNLRDFQEIKSLKCPVTKKSIIETDGINSNSRDFNFFYFVDCGCTVFSEEVVQNKIIKFENDNGMSKKLEKLLANEPTVDDIIRFESYINTGDSVCINCNSKICRFNKVDIIPSLAIDNRKREMEYTTLNNRIKLLNKLGYSHNLSKLKSKTKKKKNKLHKLGQDNDNSNTKSKKRKIQA